MLLKGVFANVQPEAVLIEVAEEDAPHVVALGDNHGVLIVERTEVGKGGAKHRVGRYVAAAAGLVKVFQPGLDGRNVAQDAVLRQERQHAAKRV